MEFLTIFLSSLLGLISPAGVIVDRTAQQAIRSQFVAVEDLQIRVDNAPSYQILQGRVERIRLAGRGLFPVKDLRLEALELETDPILLNATRLRRGKLQLRQPLRAGVRLVVKADDINRALRSPRVVAQLRNLGASTLSQRDAQQVQRYEIFDPQVELANQRVRFQVSVREAGVATPLKILAESGIEIVSGRSLRLVAPRVRVNGEAVPDRLIAGLAKGLEERVDLRALETSGIFARILQWQPERDRITVAAFVQFAAK